MLAPDESRAFGLYLQINCENAPDAAAGWWDALDPVRRAAAEALFVQHHGRPLEN